MTYHISLKSKPSDGVKIHFFFQTFQEKKQRIQSGGRFDVYAAINKHYELEKYLLIIEKIVSEGT